MVGMKAAARWGTGEGGIRTPGTGVYPYDGLANRCLKPLGHLSKVFNYKQLRQFADVSRPADYRRLPKNTATLLLSARHCKKIKDKLHDLITLSNRGRCRGMKLRRMRIRNSRLSRRCGSPTTSGNRDRSGRTARHRPDCRRTAHRSSRSGPLSARS